MTKHTRSSGNVFADLGLPDAEVLLACAELTRRIYLILKERRLTQAEAGTVLGLKQPDVSLLMRGRYTRFSADRLMRLLALLGQDVKITVRPAAKRAAQGRVRVAA